MQHNLYEFLITHKKLSLPGIGVITLQQRSAQLDFSNKQLIPPSHYFMFENGSDIPSKKLFDWLSSSFGISEFQAVKSVNDFAFDLKNKITDAGEMKWEHVGVFRRDIAGNIKLVPAEIALQTDQPVIAEKVIRDKAEHTVLVGEQEKTSAEMEEYFADHSQGRNYLWWIAIAITVLSLIFAGWYLVNKGFDPASTGNQSVIQSN
jgi:hypothetical protein